MYIVDKEELKLINRCCTAPSLLEREMEGEAILVPAFVFHSIIVKFILSLSKGRNPFIGIPMRSK